MKRQVFRLLALLLALTLLSPAAQAAGLPFREDYDAINIAAGSVLMLLVYDREEGTYVSTGSGFVAFDSRTLVTNYHVVEDGDLILAESDDGRNFFLDEVLAADSGLDLAVLRFKSDTGLLPLTLDQDGGMLRGQPVVAIGSPEGYRNTVSKGDISALFNEKGVRYIQFTAPVSHGSSGGALFNDKGEVVGVTSSSIMGDSQNMNFAIDIREAIALYRLSAAQEPYPLSALASPQSHTRPEPKTSEKPGASPFYDLKTTQTAADTVTLSWSSLAPGQTCYIGYETDGSSFYNYRDTTGLSTEIDDLVPGLRYNFFVSDSLDGLDSPLATISLALSPAKPYSARGARVLGLGLYLATRDGEPGLPLPKGLDTITTGELERARDEVPLAFVYRVLLEQADDLSTGNCVYAFFTPTGGVYTDEYYYSYESDRYAYFRRADMQDLLESVIEFEGAFPTGAWRAAVYHDGALLGETSFEVIQSGQPGTGPAEARVEEAAENQPATYPLAIGDEAYVGTGLDPYLDPDLVNLGSAQKVTGFKLAYFTEDRNFEALPFGDTGELITYLDFDTEVPPGQTINAGSVSMRQYGQTIVRIYVAIAQVRLEDGSVITIPEERLQFKDWELD